MEGRFLRRKFNIWLFLLFLSGLALMSMYIFPLIVDREATGESLTFLIVGGLICMAVIPSWLLNSGAYIRVDETSIKSKYHWFGKIDCRLSDVVFAADRVNTLIIQLKDGKTHTITGIENSRSLCSVIRRTMSFDVTEQPEILMEILNRLKAVKKNGIIQVCSCVALMFIVVFVTVFLTGGRELHEFGSTDWTIFAMMCALEIAAGLAAFRLARKTGKHTIPIEKLQYDIQRRIIETRPLLPGNAVKVFADENFTARLTFFGYPDQASVYYVIEDIASDYTLYKSYESGIYENIEPLRDGLESLIDITAQVLH